MKFHHCFLIFLLILTSCKSSKNITSSTIVAKNLSARKVAKKHTAANFTPNTVDAKLKVYYKDSKEDIGFSVKMKIKKDEVIWLKGSKFITVFKAKITPTKVSFYSPYKKNYFEGDFSMMKKLLGADVDFYQLQNILLGQAVLNVRKNKHVVEISNNAYKLAPKSQPDLFHLFYMINPVHFKLDKQSLTNKLKQQELTITYPGYIEKNKVLFPKEIKIIAKEQRKSTKIDIAVRSVLFDTKLKMPFTIPSGYKEIKL